MNSKSNKLISKIKISDVPSSFPVGFNLLTHEDSQYVVYYDSDHNMVVASRKLNSEIWTYKILPSKVGWDSHNYITMIMDSEGQIHLSGNMHCVSLIYFKTTKPGDITTFQNIKSMTGADENSCTYPIFLKDGEGRLIFHYRFGSSGNGHEVYNIYDVKTSKWSRLLDKPLISGEGKMNAYMDGPKMGPDGIFHLGWVWRNSSDCSTNHDPSYARSKDLKNWENIRGEPIMLPITISSSNVVIDPIPVKAGIINGTLRIGFDSQNNVLASYIKFDENGKTQVYISKYENTKWIPKKISNWDFRWEFSGGGSIPFGISLGSIYLGEVGQIKLNFNHVKYGSGVFIIDEKSLSLINTELARFNHPAELEKAESDYPGMKVRWQASQGDVKEKNVQYFLRWETLDANRDIKKEGDHPKTSVLNLVKIRIED